MRIVRYDCKGRIGVFLPLVLRCDVCFKVPSQSRGVLETLLVGSELGHAVLVGLRSFNLFTQLLNRLFSHQGINLVVPSDFATVISAIKPMAAPKTPSSSDSGTMVSDLHTKP